MTLKLISKKKKKNYILFSILLLLICFSEQTIEALWDQYNMKKKKIKMEELLK